ncbi:phosphoribosyltransferase-like protein [Trichophaea hybrida]|nr:phosphoribosyltransferase-like protein [Trichophaea hybrida]
MSLTPDLVDELSTLTTSLRGALKEYPDFPTPGILFQDILPIFATPSLHASLLRALEIHLTHTFPPTLSPPFAGIDAIIGLEARGFLFGPSLALKLGAAFVPVGYKKEYGEDFFEMQKGAVKKGSRVVIVDDIIATGGSAEAAEVLVNMCGGTVVEFCFLMELEFLKGREKLGAPVFTLLTWQEEERGEGVV